MKGACSVEGCSLAASHEGPHDQQCPGCEGKGKGRKGLACGYCAGIGRIDADRDFAWRYNARTSYWWADIDGGWRKDGTTIFAWPDLDGRVWKWLVKERGMDSPYSVEKAGNTGSRWTAMDEVEREAVLLRSRRAL